MQNSFIGVLFLCVMGFICIVDAFGDVESPKLLYVKETNSGCTFNIWDIQLSKKPDSLPLLECPTRFFGLTERNVVVVVTKDNLQEIKLTPSLIASKPIKLPTPPIKPGNFPATPIEVGYSKEGHLNLVMQSDYPFDDTDNFIYVLKKDGWELGNTVYCRRLSTCRLPILSEQNENSLRRRSKHIIWHEHQLNNPYVTNREILNYKNVDGSLSEVGGQLILSFKEKKSVLTYHTMEGPDTGSTHTFNIELKINDKEPLQLSNAQCEAELVGKYLLLYKFWGEGIELIDVETGVSILGKLKIAKWLY